jgi:hypothetical protein
LWVLTGFEGYHPVLVPCSPLFSFILFLLSFILSLATTHESNHKDQRHQRIKCFLLFLTQIGGLVIRVANADGRKLKEEWKEEASALQTPARKGIAKFTNNAFTKAGHSQITSRL